MPPDLHLQLVFIHKLHWQDAEDRSLLGRKQEKKSIQRPESLRRKPRNNVIVVDTLLDGFVSSWNNTAAAARHQIWWQLKRNRDIACLWWLSVCQSDNKFPKAQGKLVMKSSRGAWRGGTCDVTARHCCTLSIQDRELCVFLLSGHAAAASQGLSKLDESIFPSWGAWNTCVPPYMYNISVCVRECVYWMCYARNILRYLSCNCTGASFSGIRMWMGTSSDE